MATLQTRPTVAFAAGAAPAHAAPVAARIKPRAAKAVRVCASIAAPARPAPSRTLHETAPRRDAADLISRETIKALEAELDAGAAIAALRRFNAALRALDSVAAFDARLRPVMHELAFNLESFNPAFTAVLLRVQASLGRTDYARRDAALKLLIHPLAGEYGLAAGAPQGPTHRELFAAFFEDVARLPLADALAAWGARPPAAELLFHEMMECLGVGSRGARAAAAQCPVEAASYALGYNLAIEYLADYEKTWMLDSFRDVDARVLAPAGRGLTAWAFLEVHAEGEAEHAALGHAAAAALVPAAHEGVLRRAMLDHDRDFSAFYNRLADLLEG